ncbi:MAG: restriction endonuclease subunit S [Acinetobacter sp.]
MAKYPKYAEYKDSGIEWLGEIPSHWFNTKVKYEAYVKARVGWHGLKSDDFTDEGPYLVTGSDFKGTNIDWSQCYHCDEPRYEQEPYIQLRDGDLLITKDGTIGKVALARNLKDGEKATLNSGIFVVRPLRNNFSTKFYFWLLQSKVFKGFVDFNKTGSTIVHLYQDTFVNFEYASPNLEDQIQIANFLDHETAQIDSLIAKQEKLIELLKEKRQAVISHAVIKGLNPDVTMKDSGVEWLGQVPEHWEMKILKYIVSQQGGGTPDKSNLSFWDGDIPWVSPKDMKIDYISTSQDKITVQAIEQSSTKLVPIGSVLMVVRGMILIHSVPVALTQKSVTINQDMKALIPNKLLDSEYFLYLLKGLKDYLLDYVETSGHGTRCLRSDDFMNMPLFLPSLDEQKNIVEYVKAKFKIFDSLIDKAESAIQLMQERRTALISSAVTGKIDVRHWQKKAFKNNNEVYLELSA